MCNQVYTSPKSWDRMTYRTHYFCKRFFWGYVEDTCKKVSLQFHQSVLQNGVSEKVLTKGRNYRVKPRSYITWSSYVAVCVPDEAFHYCL